MRKIITLLITTIFFAPSCMIAQLYVEPVIGYQIDLNNKQHDFKMINSAIQFSWKQTKKYELLLQLQRSWAIPLHSTDAAFTVKPDLPLSATAEKRISPSAFSIALGNRFIVTAKRSKYNRVAVLLYVGVTHQLIDVDYQYDKNNYVILNPDQSQDRWGAFISGGVEYMRQLKNGRLFFQAIFASPPSGENPPDYSSFDFMAPLSFNAGYSILINKNEHKK